MQEMQRVGSEWLPWRVAYSDAETLWRHRGLYHRPQVWRPNAGTVIFEATLDHLVGGVPVWALTLKQQTTNAVKAGDVGYMATRTPLLLGAGGGQRTPVPSSLEGQPHHYFLSAGTATLAAEAVPTSTWRAGSTPVGFAQYRWDSVFAATYPVGATGTQGWSFTAYGYATTADVSYTSTADLNTLSGKTSTTIPRLDFFR